MKELINQKDIDIQTKITAQQISSQGYPALVLKYKNTHYPIVRDYLNANAALNEIKHLLN